MRNERERWGHGCFVLTACNLDPFSSILNESLVWFVFVLKKDGEKRLCPAAPIPRLSFQAPGSDQFPDQVSDDDPVDVNSSGWIIDQSDKFVRLRTSLSHSSVSLFWVTVSALGLKDFVIIQSEPETMFMLRRHPDIRVTHKSAPGSKREINVIYWRFREEIFLLHVCGRMKHWAESELMLCYSSTSRRNLCSRRATIRFQPESQKRKKIFK